MDTTILKLPRDWREGRRFRAWELHQQGWKQVRIAEALGVSRGAVCMWLKRAREEGGLQALRRHPAPGPVPKLSAEQRRQLPVLLARGAEAFGYRGDIWTCSRIATLIKEFYGVSYHPSHISKLLKSIGWSLQKPVRRATQRDEAAIEAWRTERWPALKNGHRKQAGQSSG